MKYRNKIGIFIFIIITLLTVGSLFQAKIMIESEHIQTNIDTPVIKITEEAIVVNPESIKDQKKAIVPVKIAIPDLGIDATVIKVGLTKEGNMDVPEDYSQVGWFELGYKPGQKGNAVMAGHVDNKNGPAIFYDLRKLIPGNEVLVYDNEGVIQKYIVTRNVVYPKGDAPMEEIFGSSETARLNLITCTGRFDNNTSSYQERLVVFTYLEK